MTIRDTANLICGIFSVAVMLLYLGMPYDNYHVGMMTGITIMYFTLMIVSLIVYKGGKNTGFVMLGTSILGGIGGGIVFLIIYILDKQKEGNKK